MTASKQAQTVKDCQYPWTWMMVSADGNVKPCCWAPGNLGNLYQASADEVWNGKVAQELRQAVLNDQVHPICAKSPCVYVQNTPVTAHIKLQHLTTEQDVLAAYKLFLNRLPENSEVVKQRVGRSAESLLVEFLSSSEFLARPDVENAVLGLAAKIMKKRGEANGV